VRFRGENVDPVERRVVNTITANDAAAALLETITIGGRRKKYAIVLAGLYCEIPVRALAERFSVSPATIRRWQRSALAASRHPAFIKIWPFEGVKPASVLHDFIQRDHQLAEILRADACCEGCSGSLAQPGSPGRGRPRRYCSDACRQAAYRARRARRELGLRPPGVPVGRPGARPARLRPASGPYRGEGAQVGEIVVSATGAS
jgi:hypothetical protein